MNGVGIAFLVVGIAFLVVAAFLEIVGFSTNLSIFVITGVVAATIGAMVMWKKRT